MAKYHQKTIDAIAIADQNRPGVYLGAVCIDAQIPVQVVAKWMGITRQGVYYWFTGANEVAEHHLPKVERVTQVLVAALAARDLPAKDLPTALAIVKQYK